MNEVVQQQRKKEGRERNISRAEIARDFVRMLCVLEYRLLSKKGEGTFSEVLKAQSTKSGEHGSYTREHEYFVVRY